MKIISFIVQPDVIGKILEHLELWEEFTQQHPPPLAQGEIKVQGSDIQRKHEIVDNGWPGYEEPRVDVHAL